MKRLYSPTPESLPRRSLWEAAEVLGLLLWFTAFMLLVVAVSVTSEKLFRSTDQARATEEVRP